MLKRLFDLVLGLFGLLLTSPIFLILIFLIKVDSRGPVFYRGIRSGLNGKAFRIYKFRTMVKEADLIGGPSTALNDPRLTRIGPFLRKYKLDELPQLLNIIKGEMSIVGPRPQVEYYTLLYKGDEKNILSVRPGLTDYASIKFINMDRTLGNDKVDEIYKTKIEPIKNMLRLEYVKNNSILIDIKIIIQTIIALVKRY